ncbi:MAG: PD-(D/E)XK nuclease family protein [Deltaproteobacteria bacterium]|nr:PD-(D/E)XK nuclease family protein [Deltaproteobacteria bacterium]
MDPDHLYLTATGRLARRLRHRFRRSRVLEDETAWERPPAVSLNVWLSAAWADAWPERVPAPEPHRINLWRTLSEKIPPPEPLKGGFGIFTLLDETYKTLVRHRIDPKRGAPAPPLVEWRRTISRAFEEALRKDGYFHPAELPLHVRQAIEADRIPCPAKVRLAGFDLPAPLEEDLFALFRMRGNCEHIDDPLSQAAVPRAVALPTREQEVQYLTRCLVEDARSIPLHRIGVVVPDMDGYVGMIEKALAEVTAEVPARGSQWFNMTRGVPLSETALVRAALLPLRFALEGYDRDLFMALLLSPYYGCWQGKRHAIARADRVWRAAAVDSGLGHLMRALKKERPDILEQVRPEPAEHLFSFLERDLETRKEGAFWAGEMNTLWKHLGFPVISDEKDTVDQGHLVSILDIFAAHLSAVLMNGREFLSWLEYLASRTTAQVSASEEAGIQVIGIIESRGLDFERLYLLDMNDGSFPQPARPLPLLDGRERALVQGGTVESQHDFARRSFSRLLRSAEGVILTRAEQEQSKPLTPSPFWPRHAETTGIDIWNDPGPAWSRATWLQAAFRGLGTDIEDTEDPVLPAIAQRDVLSPTQVEAALSCPFRYFVETIAGIEPLDDAGPGIPPRERGIALHRVLSAFTRKIREAGLDVTRERAASREIIESCVDTVLGALSRDPRWVVERERWLELKDSAQPGLLTAWLEKEAEHRLEGWQCVGEEISFQDLKLSDWPFSLRGRIDRIDVSGTGGIACWDYKTGNLPAKADITKAFKAPQLPLYLMAVREGKTRGLDINAGDVTGASAGYVQVKSLREVTFREVPEITASLDEWTAVISRLGELLKEARFPAEPCPFSDVKDPEAVCRGCPVRTVCRKGLQATELPNHEEPDET